MKIFLFLLLTAVSVTAQGVAVQPGVIVDSIPVNDSITETYSQYVPTSFDGSTEFPVIFIFDGEGRGKSAAQYFKSVAELQGYILISSNGVDSKKSFEDNAKNAMLLIYEVYKKLPIDTDDFSVAGFAEGAKVATAIPLLFPKIHGVIYIGGSYFNFDRLKKENSFAAVGIVGDRQLEIDGMQLTADHLRDKGHYSQLYIYEGGKKWPSLDVICSAVGDLTLEAIRADKRPKDIVLISRLYQQDLEWINKLISQKKFLAAQRIVDGMKAKYEDLIDIKSVEMIQRQLKRSNYLKEDAGNHIAILEKEDEMVVDFHFYFEDDVVNANFGNLGWWNYRRQELEKLTQSENNAESAMAYRLLELLTLWTVDAVEYQEEKDAPLESKMIANMLATIFNPGNFVAYKNIISLSARDGDYSTSLFYLEEMLKNGYTDSEALYDIDGTLGLKISKEFNWLIKKYLGSSKYYNNATSLY